MSYYCEINLRDIKKKSEYSHLKSKSHKEFEKNKYMDLTIENPNIDDIDEIFFAYIIDRKNAIISLLIVTLN